MKYAARPFGLRSIIHTCHRPSSDSALRNTLTRLSRRFEFNVLYERGQMLPTGGPGHPELTHHEIVDQPTVRLKDGVGVRSQIGRPGEQSGQGVSDLSVRLVYSRCLLTIGQLWKARSHWHVWPIVPDGSFVFFASSNSRHCSVPTAYRPTTIASQILCAPIRQARLSRCAHCGSLWISGTASRAWKTCRYCTP